MSFSYWQQPTIYAKAFRLLRLQQTARDVDATLKVGSFALRERALERILNNLAMFQAQLPGLGLKAQTIKSWQPVLKRWQCIIELEIEQQQAKSQGELLNPFQPEFDVKNKTEK